MYILRYNLIVEYATYMHDTSSPLNSIQVTVEALSAHFGAQFSQKPADLEAHGRDESWHPMKAPDGVVFAQSEADVVKAVEICAEHDCPIIAYGTGTSLEGHLSAVKGGISLDLSHMDKILEVSAEDLLVTVQPGVTRKQLNTYLRDQGLFFPVDPGADASFGGMAATRASGTNTLLYGNMVDNVRRLTFVSASGDVIKTGSSARKSAAGYDLTRLLIGSEGTLGIITELTLGLQGIPETMASGIVSFETIEGAVDTVIETVQYGIKLARMEILDEVQVKASNVYSSLSLPEKPLLYLEFHGGSRSVEEQIESFGELAKGNGGSGFEWAVEQEERTKLEAARHNAYYAAKAARPGKFGVVTDVCVPISKLGEAIAHAKTMIDKTGLFSPIVGHVGDGNFHLLILVDPEDAAELATAKNLQKELVYKALELGGTCTGEHGIGYGKKEFLAKEHESALPLMQQIKHALDPKNIMNPGKIF